MNLLLPGTLLPPSTRGPSTIYRGPSPLWVSMVKFSRNPSPISTWRCCGYHLAKKTPPQKQKKQQQKRGSGYAFPSTRQKTSWQPGEKKGPSFLWGLIGRKCGTRLLRFYWGASYTKKLKVVSISTYELVEMMHNWPGRSNARVRIYGPIGRSRLIETQQH